MEIYQHTSIFLGSIAIIIGLAITITYVSYGVAAALHNTHTESTDNSLVKKNLLMTIVGLVIILLGVLCYLPIK